MQTAQIIDWLIKGGGATLLLGLFTTWFRQHLALQKAQEKYVKQATFLSHLTDVIEKVVLDMQQTYVEARKKSGEWSEDAAKEAGGAAMDKLKSYLGAEGFKMLAWLLNTTDQGTLDDYLKTRLEAAVNANKFELGTVDKLADAANPSPASMH